jgi:hypothetical protein
MNKLIEELAKQAGFLAVGDEDDPVLIIGFEHDGIVSLELTKFAELIILECTEMFEGLYTDTCPSQRIDTKIKQHFGVKE